MIFMAYGCKRELRMETQQGHENMSGGRISVLSKHESKLSPFARFRTVLRREPESEKSGFPASFLRRMLAEEMEPGPKGCLQQ